jgi:thioredoxin-related protein
LEIAKNENKFVLLDFTGSDWCGWCMKLDKEVFTRKEFKDYSKEKLVLVTVDFPHEKSQSSTVKQQNKKLQDEFKITGYPSIVLLSPSGQKVGQTGYVSEISKDYPKSFLDQLNEFMEKPAKNSKRSKDT